MPPKLRQYQGDLSVQMRDAFGAGHLDVGVNSPTGSGKTVFFAHEIREHNGASVAIAHRQELVSQISIALARNEVRHRIIGASAITKNIIAMHMADGGRSYYDANARCAAAGVDTLIRLPDSDPWFSQVTFAVMDEAHHVLRNNKWGKARTKFRHPQCRALHVSATWVRADGCGLGRHADGFVDTLLHAPTMRELIDAGYLTDYRIFSVKAADLDLKNVEISAATGDLNMTQLRAATRASNRLIGDVVSTYCKYARGKLGVTFAVDVESAIEIAKAYRDAGVPAEVVSAKTPDFLRMEILRKFRRREILQLVNVDLFGEGFDLPAIECVSFARATESWALYCQQFGRVLRLLIDPALYPIWDSLTPDQRKAYIAASDKPVGIIFDHVGNVLRHMGPPDKRTEVTLDRRERSGGRSDAIPYRTCLADGCFRPYERTKKCCPFCGTPAPEPAARSGPEYVDGDLFELDAATLALMRGEVDRVDGVCHVPKGLLPHARLAVENNHWERQQMQKSLRGSIAWWSGLQNARGIADLSEQYRLFYLTYGIDILTAQALGAGDAEKLRDKICGHLLKFGVDGTVNAT